MKAAQLRHAEEKEVKGAFLGCAMFGLLEPRFLFAHWNKRQLNATVRKEMCGDFSKRGLHHKLFKNSIPIIVRREQIKLDSLVPVDLVSENIGDVVWLDLLCDILVANGRHRQHAYRDFIAYLNKTLEKASLDLAKNLKKKGPRAEAQVLECQTLITNTESQLEGLGSWLGAFYDDGKSRPF